MDHRVGKTRSRGSVAMVVVALLLGVLVGAVGGFAGGFGVATATAGLNALPRIERVRDAGELRADVLRLALHADGLA